MAAKVMLKVPESVHITIHRGTKQAMDLLELVYSHLLLPLRVYFGKDAKFAWLQAEDWIRFCNGEKVRIAVPNGGKTILVDVYHGEERVVFVKPVVEA
mgnify:CR=1 FL=1